jgi:hypothetical protein
MSSVHVPRAARSKPRKLKCRFFPALVAAASCFVAMPTFGLGLILALGGPVTEYVVWRTLVVSVACAAGTGLCLLPFRTIRWYWAVAIGALLAPLCIVVGDYVYRLMVPQVVT